MPTYFASDLHVDVRGGYQATAALAAHVVAEGRACDVLVLGGDYGNSDEHVRRCLELFTGFAGTRMGIAGNHDVWALGEDSSDQRYHRLSMLLEELGFHALEAAPVTLDGTTFVGAMGWYDYTFREESLGIPIEYYESKTPPGAAMPIWSDARFVRWGRSDVTFTDEQLARLSAHLEHARAAGDETVVMIHHVPTAKLLRPSWLPAHIPRHMVVPRKWLYANTFLGSERFSELFRRYDDIVKLVVCGHIHLSRAARFGEQRYVSIGGDYSSKELLTWDGGVIRRKVFHASR